MKQYYNQNYYSYHTLNDRELKRLSSGGLLPNQLGSVEGYETVSNPIGNPGTTYPIYQGSLESREFSDMQPFLTQYLLDHGPNPRVSSKCLDNMPKHMRLDSTGNPMYISYRVPTDKGTNKCVNVECPALVGNDALYRRLSQFYPEIRKKMGLNCWQCK